MRMVEEGKQQQHLVSSAVTPTGSVHKSRGDNVGAVEEMLCMVSYIMFVRTQNFIFS